MRIGFTSVEGRWGDREPGTSGSIIPRFLPLWHPRRDGRRCMFTSLLRCSRAGCLPLRKFFCQGNGQGMTPITSFFWKTRSIFLSSSPREPKIKPSRPCMHGCSKNILKSGITGSTTVNCRTKHTGGMSPVPKAAVPMLLIITKSSNFSESRKEKFRTRLKSVCMIFLSTIDFTGSGFSLRKNR